jgi:hypothetical protein
MGGNKPNPPQPPPIPPPPDPGQDEKLRKRSGSTRTIFTRPLGNAEQADVTRKYLLGQ